MIDIGISLRSGLSPAELEKQLKVNQLKPKVCFCKCGAEAADWTVQHKETTKTSH